ncbi:hypothetical protein [Streptomyces sp. NPDC055189]
MHRRYPVGVALAAMSLSACGTEESTARAEEGARTAVESYVEALNTRDADRLIEVGGVPDDARARREARRMLEDRGGRQLSITDVRVDLDMGPDVGSAKLAAEEKSGKQLSDTFTVVRRDGTWHLTVFTDRPAASDKPTSATE